MLLALKLPFSRRRRKVFFLYIKSCFLSWKQRRVFCHKFQLFFWQNPKTQKRNLSFSGFSKRCKILDSMNLWDHVFYLLQHNSKFVEIWKIFNFLTFDEWLDWIEKNTKFDKQFIFNLTKIILNTKSLCWNLTVTTFFRKKNTEHMDHTTFFNFFVI